MGSYTREEAIAMIDAYQPWYHRIEVCEGVVTPGINDTPTYFSLFDFPRDCLGLRVLDIGTRDGYFAFELERRGAEVTAVDYYPAEKTGFGIAAKLLNSAVQYRQMNIYEINPAEMGQFDIVLMLGLIYHLPDPMLALSLARALCRGRLYLETQVIDRAFQQQDGSFVTLQELHPDLVSRPIMQFYPRNALNNDFTNYWAPNEACMKAMLEENLFQVNRVISNGQRGLFECTVAEDPRIKHYNALSRGRA
jgi:tRNA (mo5U34)-methyltransferase